MNGTTYPLVLCAGIYRSASTWAFNVAAEILSTQRNLTMVYADAFERHLCSALDTGDCVVLKTNRPIFAFKTLCKLLNAEALISIRDPLDCVASFVGRSVPATEAIDLVYQSSEAILDLMEHDASLVLRYEEMTRGRDDVWRIARALGIDIEPERIDEIANKLSVDNVKLHIKQLVDKDVISTDLRFEKWDHKTQWHYNHLGDGASGKYSILEHDVFLDAFVKLNDVRDRLGYDNDGLRPLLDFEAHLDFARDAAIYCGKGFSCKEEWGIWTDQERALIVLPMKGIVRRVRMVFKCSAAPGLSRNSNCAARVSINGRHQLVFAGLPAGTDEITFAIADDLEPSDRLVIIFDFENLASPKHVGASDDERLLGLGMQSLQLSCDSVDDALCEQKIFVGR